MAKAETPHVVCLDGEVAYIKENENRPSMAETGNGVLGGYSHWPFPGKQLGCPYREPHRFNRWTHSGRAPGWPSSHD